MRINRANLTFVYKQNLEKNIIEYLSEKKKIDLRQAMALYYKSKLSEQIAKGVFGIENMDYKYLAEDLIENEVDLFK